MATSRRQRISIWIIAGVMLFGTLGAFAAMVLTQINQPIAMEKQAEEYQKKMEEETKLQAEEQQKLMEEYQKKMEEEAKKSQPLDGHQARPFDKEAVKKLEIKLLKEGDGQVVKDVDTLEVNYFGWLSDGKIFDSSKKEDKTKPISISIEKGSVIAGWTDGLKDQKVGSTVELTIPADQAYGEQGSGTIGPNEPLKFIVEIKSVKTAKKEN